jgi:phosphoglycolate phosphatase
VSGFHFRAVLFDLDGTLVHTLPDIAAAMNAALDEFGLRELDAAHIATLIGKGPRVLARRVLDEQKTLGADARERLVEPLLATYLRYYEVQAGKLGRIFPGVHDCLRELSARDIKLGVVTNALQHLAEAILGHFDIAPYLQVVLGGDRVTRHKPHPEPLWQACRALDVPPPLTLMVGDSSNDVAAARAAGCEVVCVPHGYNEGQPVDMLDCDIVDNFTLLPTWISAHEQRSFALCTDDIH